MNESKEIMTRKNVDQNEHGRISLNLSLSLDSFILKGSNRKKYGGIY